MKIAGVKRNINDKTLTIPTPINATMNADYDGDFSAPIRLTNWFPNHTNGGNSSMILYIQSILVTG